MSNFQISSDDKYEGRCAEIFITEKHLIVYHCSVCEEIYGAFNELLEHIHHEHYPNARETTNTKDVNDELSIDDCDEKEIDEPDVVDYDLENYLTIKPKTSNGPKKPTHEKEDDINTNEVSMICETKIQKKTVYTALLKNKTIERTEIKRFDRYQPNDTKERRYKCGICYLAFKDKCNLRNHIFRHTEPQFACSLCPRMLYSKQELQDHENRHNDVRPYLCTYCGRSFFTTSAISLHIKTTHSTEKPFQCEVCDRTFAIRSILKMHLLTHSEMRNFACTLCSTKFKTKKNLTVHMKTHNRKEQKLQETQDVNDAILEQLDSS